MPPTSDLLTASERNALGTATSTATGISAALRILQSYQRSEAVSDEANARAESMMTILRDQQGARDSVALGNAAFAQAQRLIVLARTREELAVAQRLLELAQQQQVRPAPSPSPSAATVPKPSSGSSVPTWVWFAGGCVVVTTAAVVGGLYVARRQRMTALPTPPEPQTDHSRSPAPRSATRRPAQRSTEPPPGALRGAAARRRRA